MGTIYCGPYADQIGYHRHEGYAARILPDGTETGTWTYETREFLGYRAHCDCDWQGAETYPCTDTGEGQALDEWDRHHLQPLIRAEARNHAAPADMLLDFIRSLRKSAPRTVNDDGETVFTEYAVGLLDAAEQLEHLLDDLATVQTRRVQGRR